MANYGPGDNVVCIDAMHSSGRRSRHIRAGETYTVRCINDPTGKHCVTLVGIHDGFGECICKTCLTKDSYAHFSPWRFIKLDGLKEDQTTDQEVTA